MPGVGLSAYVSDYLVNEAGLPPGTFTSESDAQI